MKLFPLALFTAICSTSVFSQTTPAGQTLSSIVNCSSKAGERQQCSADTSAGVALIRSTGESVCLLGKNWGYDSNGVWVSEGCGGEFAIGSSKEAKLGANYLGMFEAYGQLRTHLAVFNDQAEVQDNASRIGINFATRGKIKMFAGVEWGVNLIKSDNQFNLGASSGGEFGTLDVVNTPVFSARLGFVGLDIGPLGKVAVGKQNAVHYDIASYTTDRFNVFGGQGAMAYVAGTDGGVTGTGRADRVVNYRNKVFKILEVGAQTQFSMEDTGHSSDGYGFSSQLTVLPGVKLGGAYTRTYFSNRVREVVRNLNGNAEYFIFGGRLDWKFLEAGATYAQEHNGDLVRVPTRLANVTQPVAFDAKGAELFGRVRFGSFAVNGGYINQSPKINTTLLNKDFGTNYFILGGDWHINKAAFIYTETRLDAGSRTATGAEVGNVFTVGFRYDFAWKTSHSN